MGQLVLVVEDEPVLLELAQEILELGEINAIGASDAHKALSVLESEAGIGLIITDIKMPGKINGFELAWLIAERWPHIPVLVTSGHQTLKPDELPPHAQFLPKPWLISSFLDKANDMLIESEGFQSLHSKQTPDL
jgi:DNA-binding NtrC family response regulator